MIFSPANTEFWERYPTASGPTMTTDIWRDLYFTRDTHVVNSMPYWLVIISNNIDKGEPTVRT
jgi:hypothetical protein